MSWAVDIAPAGMRTPQEIPRMEAMPDYLGYALRCLMEWDRMRHDYLDRYGDMDGKERDDGFGSLEARAQDFLDKTRVIAQSRQKDIDAKIAALIEKTKTGELLERLEAWRQIGVVCQDFLYPRWVPTHEKTEAPIDVPLPP